MESMSIAQTTAGIWYCQYRVRGRKSPVREYFGKGDEGRQAAEIREAEVALSKARRETPCLSGALYLDELAQEYLRDAKRRGVGEDWRKEFAHLLNEFILPHLNHRPVGDLRWPDILDMLDGLSADKSRRLRSEVTINRYLGYLKAVFRYGLRMHLITNNPMSEWRKPVERKRRMELTIAELERLIRVASPHLAWAMEVTYETWVRPGDSELLVLKWDHWSERDHTLYVPGSKTEGAARTIPLAPHFEERLNLRRREAKSAFLVEYRGRGCKRIDGGVKRAVRLAGLTHPFTLYDIRHLAISEALRNGADLAAVSQIAGHADITTTQRRYYHCLAGEKRKAMEARPRLRLEEKGRVLKIVGGE
jgi:integrase